ncbi:hypothetical protein MTO96_011417 [Rhipicephalus appendiculatus]
MERNEETSNPTGGGDTITARDLLQVLQEKDRLLSTLLERLTVAGAAPPQPAPTFQVIPDLSHNISAFDGSEDAPSAREWIENIRRTSNLHGWPAAYTLETAKARLVGAAKDWYRSRSSQITSWEEFEVRFRRTFVSQTRVAERWRRMQERVQQRNESTTAYFHSKVRLCQEVNLDFNDTRVLTGLRSRELSTMLLGRTHDDHDDLLHDILEFERIERERRELFGSPNRSLMSPSFSERSMPATMTREETVDSNRGTDRRQPLPSINQHGERKCYNCNIYGHIARDCPEPKRPLKCQRCQATDHTLRNCQAFPSNESNVVTEALPCTGAGHVLIKEVIFNDDFALVGLIDKGSSGCLLRASAAARCGTEMVQEPTPLYGFGSKNVPATRSLGHCQAKINIDGVVAEKVPVLVAPDDAQSVDVLVGRTFTNLPFVTYGKVGSTFRFYHLNDCPFSGVVPFEQQSKLKLRPREELELQQDTVNYITTSTDRSVTGFHEQCGRDVLLDVQQEEIAEPLSSTYGNAAVIEKTSEYGRPVLVDKKNDDERLAGHQRQVFTKKYRSSNIEDQSKISAEEAKRRTTFRDPKLCQRLKKCAFGKESIDPSVSCSTRGRREPTEEKTSATSKLPKPQTVHDIKRLFRLGSFCRNLTPEARPYG